MNPLFAAAVLLFGAVASASLDSITAGSLRKHVAFLASDELEGRDTPSAGLNSAADYIASEFGHAGLEPLPGGDYFQRAAMIVVRPDSEPADLRFGSSERVDSTRMSVAAARAVDLHDVRVFKWVPGVRVDGSLAGAIAVLRTPPDPAIASKLTLAGAGAVIVATRGLREQMQTSARLLPAGANLKALPVILSVPEMDLGAAFGKLHSGWNSIRASLRIAAPAMENVSLRNVAGILPGSDPQLRNQYVLVTAHYDHIGRDPATRAIFHGANDDASGTAAVIEIARALAGEVTHPRRTVVFVCFFGEEKGLLGSAYYIGHPFVPLAGTVADINLEQLGVPAKRHFHALSVSGMGYSNLGKLLRPGIESSGVRLLDVGDTHHFFERSDNIPFAKAGIPAHTFSAAFEFPDYHRISDEASKLDYGNMAELTRALATAISSLANSDTAPAWNPRDRIGKEFLSAWQGLQSAH